MELISFCKKSISDAHTLADHTVIVVHGAPVPLMFWFWWRQELTKQHLTVIAIDCQQHSLQEAQAQLLSFCLGSPYIFWLQSFDELDKKSKQAWWQFLQTYQGPHVLITFHEEEIQANLNKQITLLKAPMHMNQQQFVSLFELLTHATTSSTHLAHNFQQKLFAYKAELPFDFACMAVWYGVFLGKQVDQFFSTWLPTLVVPDQSLFTLSQYFFAHNAQQFFKIWYTVKDLYPLAFWIAFWSDQLWRGYTYIHLMEQHKNNLAKRASYKLPFSFLQKDWKSNSLIHLQQLHEKLYMLDYRFKQGLSADLELWYCIALYRDNF